MPLRDERHRARAAQGRFVVVTTPLTAETRQSPQPRTLDLLKPEAVLVNSGRSTGVGFRRAARKARQGELAGAVLDVFQPEPLPADSPMLVHGQPHRPAARELRRPRYIEHLLDFWFANLERLLAGKACERRGQKLGY